MVKWHERAVCVSEVMRPELKSKLMLWMVEQISGAYQKAAMECTLNGSQVWDAVHAYYVDMVELCYFFQMCVDWQLRLGLRIVRAPPEGRLSNYAIVLVFDDNNSTSTSNVLLTAFRTSS